MAKRPAKHADPVVLNRKARHDYTIDETLEVGVVLVGSEVKSIRAGGASLSECYVRAEDSPPTLTLFGMHVQEYAPAAGLQHLPTRTRRLLAHKREIVRLAGLTKQKGVTLVPLRLYFVRGRVKLEIGVARGKRQSDKRESLIKREAQRDIDRAMSTRRP